MAIKFHLKELLYNKRISQIELSEQTNIRLPTISDICTNKVKQLPVKNIDRICEILECSPWDWIEYIPNNSANDVDKE